MTVRSCETCKRARRTELVTFRANVSLFFTRKETTISGYLCWICATKYFVGYELTTLVGTWWGIIGMLVGPVFLLQNILEYVTAMFLFVTKR
jgi:hypothetical protein